MRQGFSGNMNLFVKTAGKVANVAVDTTVSLLAKGRDKAEQIALQKRLNKAQRQLGALVYAQNKTGKTDEIMISRYIAEMDDLKSQLAAFEPLREETLNVTTFNTNKGARFVAVASKNYPQKKASSVVWHSPEADEQADEVKKM